MPCCYVSLARKADTVLEKRRKANFPFFLTHPHSLTPPPRQKKQNKTQKKTKENKTKRNETKRNETKQNKTKRNKNKT